MCARLLQETYFFEKNPPCKLTINRNKIQNERMSGTEQPRVSLGSQKWRVGASRGGLNLLPVVTPITPL
jgi:hypothetical protein